MYLVWKHFLNFKESSALLRQPVSSRFKENNLFVGFEESIIRVQLTEAAISFAYAVRKLPIIHSLIMNKDNQDSTYGYPPDIISPEELSSLIQKRNRRPIIGKSECTLQEPFQKLSIPGKAPVSIPELPENISGFGESQSASLVPKTKALSSQLQQTGSNPAELPLPSRFQTDQQTSSDEKFLGSVLQHPRTISNFSTNQSASTLGAPNFHSQQMPRNPVDALPLQTQFQHHQQTSSVERFLGSVSQHQQTISNFSKHQSSSALWAPSSYLQQTGNNPAVELPLPTQFWHDQQTSSVEKFLGSFSQHPQSISNFKKKQSESALRAPISHSPQTGSNPTDALPLQTRFQHDQQTSSVEKFLGSVSQHQQTISNFSKNPSASALYAPSSHSQQMGSNPTAELSLPTQFRHDQQTSSVEKFLGSGLQYPRTTESAMNYQSTSISRKSEDLKRFPTLCSLLISPSKRQTCEPGSPSKKQKTRPFSWSSESQFTSRKHETAICTEQKTRNFSYNDISLLMFPSKHETLDQKNRRGGRSLDELRHSLPQEKHETAICTKQKTRNFSYNDVSLLTSPSKHESLELTSPSKKQKTRTFSWSTEAQFASRKHEAAICTKQKTNFSYPDETFASRKKVTSVSLGSNEEKQSTPVKTMSASIEQATSELHKQQTGLCPILGEPKSSSESSLKDSFSKDYEALQGTEIEKDVDRLAERLDEFDKFICVQCGAKFADQDKLLRHEPIHFNG